MQLAPTFRQFGITPCPKSRWMKACKSLAALNVEISPRGRNLTMGTAFSRDAICFRVGLEDRDLVEGAVGISLTRSEKMDLEVLEGATLAVSFCSWSCSMDAVRVGEVRLLRLRGTRPLSVGTPKPSDTSDSQGQP